jgi:transcriptional regulator with XRE-family HTH domain
MIQSAQDFHRERLRRGLSLREVARRAGLPPAAVIAFERSPSPQDFAALNAVLEAAPVRFELVGEPIPTDAARVICS